VSRENPQIYGAGAVLANGAHIKEIHADRVVLERDGNSVTLYVDGNKLNSKELNDLLIVGGKPAPKFVAANMREILTDYIRPSPVYDGDVIKGFEVYAGQRSGVFSQLGLQNGDVLLAINDMPFNDPQQAISMFKQLTDGMSVVASVERQGNVERISLDGALISEDQQGIKNPSPQLPMPGPAM
jgi:general secretion pathway protein C